jgi:hypothetical protein
MQSVFPNVWWSGTRKLQKDAPKSPWSNASANGIRGKVQPFRQRLFESFLEIVLPTPEYDLMLKILSMFFIVRQQH